MCAGKIHLSIKQAAGTDKVNKGIGIRMPIPLLTKDTNIAGDVAKY
jgi:hypothetical protein